MRDSEVQAMQPGCVSPVRSADGLVERYRLRSTVYKRHGARGVTADWITIEPVARAVAVMEARADEIRGWITRESGSTQVKAAFELGAAQAITAEAATFPTRAHGQILATSTPGEESRVYRAPLGVISVISPWNFPLNLSMRSVAPALALGNAVVLKPASDTPVTGGTLLGKILEEAGLPPGLLNVIVGSGSEIGDYFVEHPTPSLVSFTGSTDVGRRVGAIAAGGRWIKRVALELGGNAPIVVLADADPEAAARAAVFGRFLHQGQICMSTNRAIVDAGIYDAFVEAVARRVSGLTSGNPADPATNVGPIINAQQLAGIQRKIEAAKAAGARLVAGGEAQGNVLPPHVFADVDPEWEIAADETFGPVLPIIKARDEAHALELANATEYGLSCAVISGNPERGVRFARGIRAGMAHVNSISVDDHAHAPFGGEKNSGLGRFNGEWVMEEFTRTQWITTRDEVPVFPF
jgi:aldehyde dehydrogenase (NAD+)